MSMTLGVFIGESFAELTLADTITKEKIDFQRWYLPRTSLKAFLTKYIAEKEIKKIDQVFVAHRYLEKLFNLRIGGSVAQLVTVGFENVLNFESPSNSDLPLWPQKAPSVSSSDLVFSVNEKVDSEGNLQKEIDSTELEHISAKLKLMEVKRVCLHFHNSRVNKHNLSIAAKTFEAAGFDVFIPEFVSENNEFQCWRKNLVEAALTGTFVEIQEELKLTLSPVVEENKIYYLDSDLKWFQQEKTKRIGSIVALENLWMKIFPTILNLKEEFDVFHFGLENFSLIQNKMCNWETVWGKLPITSYRRADFQLQPTQSLKLSDNNELVIDKKELTFEPGPVTMGRGVVPCIYDVLNYSEQLATDLKEKLKRSLQALIRSSQSGSTAEQSLGLLKKNILNLLAAHVEFNRSAKSKQIIVYGYMAEKNEKDLKQHSYFSKLLYVSETTWPKSFLITLWGLQTRNDK